MAGVNGIYELSPSERTTKAIIDNQESQVYYSSVSWSPTGEEIVFASNDTTGSKIYIIRRDGDGLRLLGNELGLEQYDPAWSPDGEHIAYTTTLDLYVTGADGLGLQHLAQLPALEFPAWSPDGKKLAFIADHAGDNEPYKIYLVDSNGNNLHSITGAIAGMSHLAWSPDGNYIAFRSFDGCGDINVLNLKSGVITNLTNTPETVELDPVWSSDGNYIVFSKANYAPCAQDQIGGYYGGEDIFIMKSTGQEVTQLTFSKGATGLSWWPIVTIKLNWKYRKSQKRVKTSIFVKNPLSLQSRSPSFQKERYLQF